MLTQIKANTVTHLCCLITGDRFYFKSDAQKEVSEIRYHTTLTIRGIPTKFSQCKNDQGKRDSFNSNRVVVYLRSTNPRRQPGYKKHIDTSLDRFFIH